jgi:hypothetical protein
MNILLRLFVAALLVAGVSSVTACRKRKAETAPSSSLPAEPMFRIATAPTLAAQLKLLTDALTAWEEQSGGRAMTNLNQLVESRIIDQLPAPPPGQQFVIDGRRHQVMLASP